MILTLVAELLAGETQLADRGPVDTATAAAEDVELWGEWRPAHDERSAEVEVVGAVAAAEERTG